MNKDSKIYIAGHSGMVGSAIIRRLNKLGYTNIITKDKPQLDLLDSAAVKNFFEQVRPEFVIDSAARVGGIKANLTYPAEFLYENLQIQNNLMWSAKENDVKKFLFLGSSCIYPRESPQPMKEEYLLSGKPEPTNEGYAVAKIAGIKLCEYIYNQYNIKFISCMPTNIYGPNDNFNPETSHVIPSLIRRMIEAKENDDKEVVIWGTGISRREFLHVDDLASAILWFMEKYDGKEFLNVGTGTDISIKELSLLIKQHTGYEGQLVFDATKPDGMPKKLLEVSKIHEAGWSHEIDFDQGLQDTISWYQRNR